VGGLDAGIQGLQNIVTLLPTLNQANQVTGYCDPNAHYWDIGVMGDMGATTHDSGYTLNPMYSVLTDTADYDGSNQGGDPAVTSQYCNGSRRPPEVGGNGIQVPPGISDAVIPNPLFSLTPSATPDEGNNWINLQYGPLSLVNAANPTTPGAGQPAMGNYTIQPGSSAIANGTADGAPSYDFFGNARGPFRYDIGAVQWSPSNHLLGLFALRPQSRFLGGQGRRGQRGAGAPGAPGGGGGVVGGPQGRPPVGGPPGNAAGAPAGGFPNGAPGAPGGELPGGFQGRFPRGFQGAGFGFPFGG
jgi:hypothetical protein